MLEVAILNSTVIGHDVFGFSGRASQIAIVSPNTLNQGELPASFSLFPGAPKVPVLVTDTVRVSRTTVILLDVAILTWNVGTATPGAMFSASIEPVNSAAVVDLMPAVSHPAPEAFTVTLFRAMFTARFSSFSPLSISVRLFNFSLALGSSLTSHDCFAISPFSMHALAILSATSRSLPPPPSHPRRRAPGRRRAWSRPRPRCRASGGRSGRG